MPESVDHPPTKTSVSRRTFMQAAGAAIATLAFGKQEVEKSPANTLIIDFDSSLQINESLIKNLSGKNYLTPLQRTVKFGSDLIGKTQMDGFLEVYDENPSLAVSLALTERFKEHGQLVQRQFEPTLDSLGQRETATVIPLQNLLHNSPKKHETDELGNDSYFKKFL